MSGHNGAGKSTLFQALDLALRGSLVLGDRVSQRAYSDFLLSRLHHHSQDGALAISEEGGVALGFQYVQSGQPLHIQVERLWRISPSVSPRIWGRPSTVPSGISVLVSPPMVYPCTSARTEAVGQALSICGFPNGRTFIASGVPLGISAPRSIALP